jgi:hypothetical protein
MVHTLKSERMNDSPNHATNKSIFAVFRFGPKQKSFVMKKVFVARAVPSCRERVQGLGEDRRQSRNDAATEVAGVMNAHRISFHALSKT